MTPRQQRFVEEYLIDRNATQAAVRAGYSAKVANREGHRLLTNADIRAAVDEGIARISERAQVTAEYVLKTIHDTVERCRQAAPVLDRLGHPVFVETPDGGIAPAYTFDASGALKGCELLGKHLKLFTERHEHTGKDGGPIEYRLTDDARSLLEDTVAGLTVAGAKPNGATKH